MSPRPPWPKKKKSLFCIYTSHYITIAKRRDDEVLSKLDFSTGNYFAFSEILLTRGTKVTPTSIRFHLISALFPSLCHCIIEEHDFIFDCQSHNGGITSTYDTCSLQYRSSNLEAIFTSSCFKATEEMAFRAAFALEGALGERDAWVKHQLNACL